MVKSDVRTKKKPCKKKMMWSEALTFLLHDRLVCEQDLLLTSCSK